MFFVLFVWRKPMYLSWLIHYPRSIPSCLFSFSSSTPHFPAKGASQHPWGAWALHRLHGEPQNIAKKDRSSLAVGWTRWVMCLLPSFLPCCPETCCFHRGFSEGISHSQANSHVSLRSCGQLVFDFPTFLLHSFPFTPTPVPVVPVKQQQISFVSIQLSQGSALG